MFAETIRTVKKRLLVSVPDNYKAEFEISIKKNNLSNARITSLSLILLTVVLILTAVVTKGDKFFEKPDVFYPFFDSFLLIAMIAYFFIATRLQKNIAGSITKINIAEVFFVVTVLGYCASISLIDQSTGKIFVYVLAVIAIAAVGLFKPITLLVVYVVFHIGFIFAMANFLDSYASIFRNSISSTACVIISWVISYMRYKEKAEDFKNRKIIQEQSDKLKQINIELEEVNQKLEKLSKTDSLTGISNRLVFDRTISAEWDRCKRDFRPISLMMIDIDFFKALNDNYGHQAGDNCIKKVAKVLSSCAKRSSDTVVRYGGDEFAIILPNMEKEHALELAEQMRKIVESLAIPHEYSVAEYVTISVGISTAIPSNKSTTDEFIKNADKALYRAKKYRNNIVVA